MLFTGSIVGVKVVEMGIGAGAGVTPTKVLRGNPPVVDGGALNGAAAEAAVVAARGAGGRAGVEEVTAGVTEVAKAMVEKSRLARCDSEAAN